MIPLVIWLEKREIDDLIDVLIKSDSTMRNNEVFVDNELVRFAEDLMKQNAVMLKLLQKLELLEPSKMSDFNVQRFFEK